MRINGSGNVSNEEEDSEDHNSRDQHKDGVTHQSVTAVGFAITWICSVRSLVNLRNSTLGNEAYSGLSDMKRTGKRTDKTTTKRPTEIWGKGLDSRHMRPKKPTDIGPKELSLWPNSQPSNWMRSENRLLLHTYRTHKRSPGLCWPPLFQLWSHCWRLLPYLSLIGHRRSKFQHFIDICDKSLKIQYNYRKRESSTETLIEWNTTKALNPSANTILTNEMPIH